MFFRVFAMMFPIILLGGSGWVNAQVQSYCAQAQDRYEDALRRSRPKPLRGVTQEALNEITSEALEHELDNPVEARDRILDRNPPVRTKHQGLLVRRMEVVYCEIIFSETDDDTDAKLAQFNVIVKAVNGTQPFVPVATTRNRRETALHESPGRAAPAIFMALAGFNPSGHILLAQDETSEEYEPEFLAEAPYFINDTNKYFVIIASAQSRKKGIRMMNQLKEAAPQYDFALYPPYRSIRTMR